MTWFVGDDPVAETAANTPLPNTTPCHCWLLVPTRFVHVIASGLVMIAPSVATATKSPDPYVTLAHASVPKEAVAFVHVPVPVVLYMTFVETDPVAATATK